MFFDKKTSFSPLFQFISHLVRTMGDIVVQLKIYSRTTIECIVVQLKGVLLYDYRVLPLGSADVLTAVGRPAEPSRNLLETDYFNLIF